MCKIDDRFETIFQLYTSMAVLLLQDHIIFINLFDSVQGKTLQGKTDNLFV